MDLTINQIEPGSRYFKSVCRILERRIVKENLVSNGGTLNYDNVTYESDHLLIALTGKKIIGYASILDGEDAYYIYQIAVGKEYQGQGVGSALVERVKAIAASENKNVTANIRDYNVNSRKMFTRLGFVQTGVTAEGDGFYTCNQRTQKHEIAWQDKKNMIIYDIEKGSSSHQYDGLTSSRQI